MYSQRYFSYSLTHIIYSVSLLLEGDLAWRMEKLLDLLSINQSRLEGKSTEHRVWWQYSAEAAALPLVHVCRNLWSIVAIMCIVYFLLLLFTLQYLVLPYINMHPPQVYTCSPSWTPLPPPSPYHPSGSLQCTSPKHRVSCIEPGLATRFLYDIIHVLMPFSQIIPPSLSHRVQKIVLYICVSFAVSHTGLSLPSF